jgi:monofunctional biosynthetic peptidoglycan transglycosylase
MAVGDGDMGSGEAVTGEAGANTVAEAAVKPRRFNWRMGVKRVVWVLAGLAAIPVLLVPTYALVPPPASTLMLWDLVTFKGYTRDWVSFDEISPHLVQSVVMSEDGRYCEHGGVDFEALQLVLGDSGGPSRGASTITMQTVKNLYLWNSRSYLRKGLEIPIALYADLVWSKRRTMEIYLNIAEWGPNLYGAEAAAQSYFGKPAAKLTRREAALMAAALPNPILRNPKKPGKYQQRYARTIERRAMQSGAYIGCLYDKGT